MIYITTDARRPKTTDKVIRTRANFSQYVGCTRLLVFVGILETALQKARNSKTDANYTRGSSKEGEAALAWAKLQIGHERPRKKKKKVRRKATGVSTWGFALSVNEYVVLLHPWLFSSKDTKNVELEWSNSLHALFCLTCFSNSQGAVPNHS